MCFGNIGGAQVHSSSDCCHCQLQQRSLVLSFCTFLLDGLQKDLHAQVGTIL